MFSGRAQSSGSILSLRDLVVIVVALGLLGFFDGAIGYTVGAYERAMFAVAPSAQRAASYGERHIDARQFPALYDIDRAEYYYEELEKIDPTYPYLYHQRARIEFLRGHFIIALSYINKEIETRGADEPNTYYVRGLIEGYMGRYKQAAEDYATYLKSDPYNWAALNDYAWVLLKAGRPDKALEVISRGPAGHQIQNAWLLNSKAIALYELGRMPEALEAAKQALTMVGNVKEKNWLTAYPGNDPKIAGEGIAALKRSIETNMKAIELAIK
ncbi:MAG: hypothetical protein UY74_C0001G0013 [Candidatus Kaiserbacteria bacterium GW2011_GWC2_52_8b]|uniref:Uncharacterized protein n=2 Tax=Candidatus Kaiseribacteriota TaxID=1752734 RepID=A0A0G1XME3_9BACT|nr:MAG: hypothetical protein UY67_C0001G0015 [Candidatus Kaiserbacteria bacterium GW2011_GWA2_52_12]KKW32040.1 MAG: hypothetical protein UY74_C0001G0013 [Candidatus Kaiserbacteria bacterium GW2011_GWC2_52_8b]